jgi:probable rRNA maturation factor
MNRPSATKVAVRNLQRKVRVNIVELEWFAQKAALRCLRMPKQRTTDLERLAEVSVLLVSDRRMAALHRRFMNERGPTDVITFQHGEIFIGIETALRNARRFKSSLGRELQLYIVHGLLHLHGFDDADEKSTKRMRWAEKKTLLGLE